MLICFIHNFFVFIQTSSNVSGLPISYSSASVRSLTSAQSSPIYHPASSAETALNPALAKAQLRQHSALYGAEKGPLLSANSCCSTAGRPCTSVHASSLSVNQRDQSRTLSTPAGTPTLVSMNRKRDISAPVFSQPCSEEVDDVDPPPPYKPTTAASAKPKLPITTPRNLNKTAEVEKKIEKLAEELTKANLEEPQRDAEEDSDYFGESYFLYSNAKVINM